MAQVAIAIANRDGAAVIASRGIKLETGKLLLASRNARILIDHHSRPSTMQHGGVARYDLSVTMLDDDLPCPLVAECTPFVAGLTTGALAGAAGRAVETG